MKAVNVDDVLKILHKYGKYIFTTDEKKYSSMVYEIANIKALKQEPQKMGRWIPVSERLPENIGDYMVTYDYTNFREDFENTVGTCWWSGKELGWQCEIYLKVVAWMPLPEPYKAEVEQQESEDAE